MQSPVTRALAGIRRVLIGGFRTEKYSGNTRSRYMPHIGAKERARHAGKPDGKMHLTPHEHRAAMLEVSRTAFAINTGRVSP